MEQRLWMILQLFGGAALFLYSMDTLTDALQQAAGDTLRQALARLTAHPLAGVLTGAAVTAVVQSSSAVTVLVLGLVGAGLLTLQRAVPVVFGANIGTTVTAQLLAFRLEDARYLLLVAGLLLWFAGRGRLHAAGQALVAFGLLFEGIAVMAEAMEPLAAGPVFRQWMAQVRHRPGLGLLAGLGMTLAVQSSSATIAVLPRAAAGITRTVACRRTLAQTGQELDILVDNGCTVLDVIVEHPVYGQLTGQLQISSRYDVEQFLARIRDSDAAPLSMLTGGLHLHTLCCPNEDAYTRACAALKAAGLLLDD